jgi:hypothetical protein
LDFEEGHSDAFLFLGVEGLLFVEEALVVLEQAAAHVGRDLQELEQAGDVELLAAEEVDEVIFVSLAALLPHLHDVLLARLEGRQLDCRVLREELQQLLL